MDTRFYCIFFITTALLIVESLSLAPSNSNDKPNPGWRQSDRFSAFRFECTDVEDGSSSLTASNNKRSFFNRRAFAVAIRDFADSITSFGWVQIANKGSETGSVVGEFRGTRSTANLFRDFLERGPEDAQSLFYSSQIEDYPDTRIRYHFSHFVILDDERITCFHQPPHQCQSEDELSNVDQRGMEL